ncbi:GCN5-like N-acetyltransferase [Kordiimonas sediminis]|uniref:GCN5-like N-acetyltransferase n=1 Tax=Kordiimonas sediminis TaxID=1735581 RepID=A0A919E7A9_9PROT|nr:N-acetyltransferase [Kordiimonas sediminis]GHF19472.1 GCN5-like N-acetyltransferase [Kordiimonas sediminis]
MTASISASTDAGALGAIIAESFADDPVNSWVFQNKKALEPFFTAVATKLYVKHGFCHIHDDGLGAALWLSDKTRKHIPLWNSLDILANIIRYSGFSALKRGMMLDAAMDKVRPVQPHYYLFAIGAVPEAQGRGVGSALLREGLRLADADEMPVYLESSKKNNVPFYQRFGFEVMDTLEPGADCPPLWPMWRPAK